MQVETGRLRVVAPEGQGASTKGDAADRRAGADGSDDSSGEVRSPGRYIRAERKRRGLTLEQLAVATKIPASNLQLLEEDRYDELPGPVFVKGFLRCCARSLGVAPDEVMGLMYERERAALQARRPRAPTGSQAAAEPVRRRPPRIRKNSAPATAGVSRLLERIPSATLFLWIAVAFFVAMLVLAAFNLMSAAAPTGPT